MTDTRPPRPQACAVPAGSHVATRLGGASFHDAWCTQSRHVERSALAHFLDAAQKTPRWVEAAMGARNRVVRLFGLKDLGGLGALDTARPADSYQPGERIGIFTLFEQTHHEALLGDRDKHLDVLLSVHCAPAPQPGQVCVTVTTVVHVHRLLGHLYMLPVKPAHRVITPAVLRRLA
jgi:Protein of unknown function (DUF2867)